MSASRGESRRAFLARSLAGAAGVGIAQASADGADVSPLSAENPWRYDVDALTRVDPALVAYDEERRFDVGARPVHRIVATPEGGWIVAAGFTLAVFTANGERAAAVRLKERARCVAPCAEGRFWVGLRDRVELWSMESGWASATWPAFPGRPLLSGIAAAGDDVFVADSGNRVVWRCDREGRVLGRIGEKDPEREIPGLVIPSPYLDVEIGEDGLLRVNNPGRRSMELYTPAGDLEARWGKSGAVIDAFCGCCNPVGFAVLPDGRCVTAEKGLPRAKVFSALGEFERVVAGPQSFAPAGWDQGHQADESEGLPDGGLDVAAGADGRIAVLDLKGRRVHVFRRASESTSKAGTTS